MKERKNTPEFFWKSLKDLLVEHTGIIADLLIEEALLEMNKSSVEEITIPEVPVFLDRLYRELEKIMSPAFLERFKEKTIKLFNETFTSL